jgi:hypothetical protein
VASTAPSGGDGASQVTALETERPTILLNVPQVQQLGQILGVLLYKPQPLYPHGAAAE